MPYLQPLEFNECIIDSPYFREKLLQHEKEIDSSHKVFKDIYNSIKNVFKTLEGINKDLISIYLIYTLFIMIRVFGCL